MEEIFHEKQEGQLCAQHCLNALLQGPYYTAVDLATIAQQLDEEERNRMAGGEAGEQSDEYRRFLAQPSSNMDDTGFFSVQVIAKALAVWGLDIVSFSSSDPVAVIAKSNPTSQSAFICNYREHWFTIRKIGNQWFNLNSLLTGPELVSNTFLSMFLVQLETEGYTIYIVNGPVPECRADAVLRLVPATRARPPQLISEAGSEGSGRRGLAGSSIGATTTERQDSGEDAELRAAMAMSLEGQRADNSRTEEEELKLAMQLSKSMMEQEEKMLQSAMSVPMDHSKVVSEEDQLQEAIAMSLQSRSQDNDELKNALALSMPATKEAIKSTKQEPDVQPSTSKAPVVSGAKSVSPKAAAGQSKTPDLLSPTKSTARAPQTPTKSTATAPQAPTIPKAPTTTPGPSQMPGEGQSLSGERLRASQIAQRQSTPDPEEVRRRRLAFLEKKQ